MKVSGGEIMAIRIRNKNYWTPTENEMIEDTGKGTVFENPYTKGPKRKLQQQYKKYLTELPSDSPQWTRIEELKKINETQNINLLCNCYPDPSHASIIQNAIKGTIQPTQ
jgi:hypothetical protein